MTERQQTWMVSEYFLRMIQDELEDASNLPPAYIVRLNRCFRGAVVGFDMVFDQLHNALFEREFDYLM